jgi:spore coat protein U-like protein
MMFKKTLIATALIAFGGMAMNASAASPATGQFTVSLVVNKTCIVNTTGASNIVLAAVNSGVAESTTGQSGTFTVNCSNKTPFFVGLAPSNANTTGAGVMSGQTAGNTTTTIPYQLAQNAAGTTVWGNTATSSVVGNGESGTGGGMAAGKAVSFTAYANVTGGATSTDVAPDTYLDTVTINVNF